MPRFQVLLALASVALTAPRGHAQPPGTGSPLPQTPLIVALLPYIGDEGVQKELKMTADQSKRLIAYRQKEWDAMYTTAPKDRNLETFDKAAVAEFAAVFSAEQLKRAKQIAAQVAWKEELFFGVARARPALDYFSVPVSAVKRYPEIGTALKLDEAQKKLVGNTNDLRVGRSIYLTLVQSEVVRELLGPPYTPEMTAQYDPRNYRFGTSLGELMTFRYTASPDVQKDLKLTAEQIAALDELRKKYSINTRGGGFSTVAQDLSPEASKKAQDELLATVTATMEKILTAEQRTRLDQLSRSGTDISSLFLVNNGLGKQLEITAEQRTAYQMAKKAHDEAVAKAVLADEPVEQVRVKVQALNKAHNEAVEAMLIPAQKAKWKELLGPEFKGQLLARGFGRDGFGSDPNAVTRERNFGKYVAQLSILATTPGLQTELKMTEEQIKKVRDANQELTTKYPFRSPFTPDDDTAKQQFAERSAFIEKHLTDILDKDQRTRFRELQLQQLEATANAAGTPRGTATLGATGYPGVAEAIKLTAEQKKKLLAAEKSSDVLTDEQKKAIQEMFGKPADLAAVFNRFTFTQRPGSQGTRPTLSLAYRLLFTTKYWSVIKLSPDQIAKLVPAANEYTAATATQDQLGGGRLPEGLGGPFATTDPAKLKAAIDSFTAAADAILMPDQKKRLGQLALQERAASSLVAVLGIPTNSDVQKELGLSNEQKTKINSLMADTMQLNLLLRRGRDGFIDIQSTSETVAKLRDRLDERILKVLTPDQMAKWKEMLGEPYPGIVKQPIILGRGGVGGFGEGSIGP